MFPNDNFRFLQGFQGDYCVVWDRDKSLPLVKVDSKGGNRPI